MKIFLLRTLFSAIILVTLLISPSAIAAKSAPASACPTSGTSKSQILSGVGETGNDCSTSGVPHTISAAVQILSFVVGVAAIIMIILAGFKYITSGGDSGKVGNAKNTLIYALVGVAIAALAQLMVHFILNRANTAGT